MYFGKMYQTEHGGYSSAVRSKFNHLQPENMVEAAFDLKVPSTTLIMPIAPHLDALPIAIFSSAHATSARRAQHGRHIKLSHAQTVVSN